MAARSAHMLDGPTWYGAHNQSHIDHILMPVEAPHPIRCVAMYHSMHRLQLAKVCEPRDHVPVLMIMQMEYGVPHKHERIRLDTGAIMKALTTGQGRSTYLQELEGQVSEVRDKIAEAEQLPYTDDLRDLLAGAVRRAAVAAFLPQTQERRELSAERNKLLEERRGLRGALDADGDEVFTTQLALALVARRMRTLRRREEAARRQQLLDEAWQRWKARRFHDIHQVRVRLARNRRAPRKRTYGIPRPPVPGVRACHRFLARDGCEGGMRAEKIDIVDYARSYIQEIVEADDEPFPLQDVQYVPGAGGRAAHGGVAEAMSQAQELAIVGRPGGGDVDGFAASGCS